MRKKLNNLILDVPKGFTAKESSFDGSSTDMLMKWREEVSSKIPRIKPTLITKRELAWLKKLASDPTKNEQTLAYVGKLMRKGKLHSPTITFGDEIVASE